MSGSIGDSARKAVDVDEAELVVIARQLARHVAKGGIIHLRGDLGAGKTTFARALLGALGVGARIKSPTYSLIESYEVFDLHVHHLDLYRIADPEEIEWLGLSDLATGCYLMLIEWPERAGETLPVPDLIVHLAHKDIRRELRLQAVSGRGAEWLTHLEAESTS